MPPLLGYVPFVSPLPLWDVWYLLLLPLCLGVSLVYKAVELDDMRRLSRQTLVNSLWIVLGMVGGAIVLAGIVWAFGAL